MTGSITMATRLVDVGGGGVTRNIASILMSGTDGSAASVKFKDRLAGEYEEGAALSDTGSGDLANSVPSPQPSEMAYVEPGDNKAVAITPPVHPILAPIGEMRSSDNTPADGEAPASRGGRSAQTTVVPESARGEARLRQVSLTAVAPGEPATRQAQAPQVTAEKTESQPIDAPVLAKMTRFDAELSRAPGAPSEPRAPIVTEVAAATVPASSGNPKTDTTSSDRALPQPGKDLTPQAALPENSSSEKRTSEAQISSSTISSPPLGKITPRAPSPGNEPAPAAAQPASSEANSPLPADALPQPQKAPGNALSARLDSARAEPKPASQPIALESATRKGEMLSPSPVPAVAQPVQSSSETISTRRAAPAKSLTAADSYDGGQPLTSAPDGGGLLSATLSGNPSPDVANLVHGQVGQVASSDKFAALAQAGEVGAARNAVLDFSAGLAWIDTLASEITAMASDSGALSFDLAPEKLGKMNVSLEKSESGMEIAIHVSNKEAANLLATSQTQLKQELTNAGLQLGAFDIGGQAMAGHDGDGGTAARAGADDMAEGRQSEAEVEQVGSDTQNVGRLGGGHARFA